MNRLTTGIFGFSGAATRLGGVASQILQDRLELLALEVREAKIRFVQALLLVCMGVVFSLLGLALLTGISLRCRSKNGVARLVLAVPGSWAQHSPQSWHLLEEEAQSWARTPWQLVLETEAS